MEEDENQRKMNGVEGGEKRSLIPSFFFLLFLIS